MAAPEGGTLSSRAGPGWEGGRGGLSNFCTSQAGAQVLPSIQFSEPLQVPSNAFSSSPLNQPNLILLPPFNGNLTTNPKFKLGLAPQVESVIRCVWPTFVLCLVDFRRLFWGSGAKIGQAIRNAAPPHVSRHPLHGAPGKSPVRTKPQG